MIRSFWLLLCGKRSTFVSARWLSDLDRQSSRVDFESVPLRFPIRKLINHASPRVNANVLRRRA